MIAENNLSMDEASAPVGDTAASRHNRNLSSIVSTIRDDGPSTAENVQPLHPGNSSPVDVAETPVDDVQDTATQRQRVRALPGMAVMAKVVAVSVVVMIIGAMMLVASGRYPVIDDRGLHIAELPASAAAEMGIVKSGIQDTFSQWLVQVKLLLSGDHAQKPEIPLSGVAGLATVEARQQQIMSRLDVLAADVDTLRAQFERDQADRLVSSATHRAEQDLQLQAVQAQLAGLQQLADDRTTVPAAPQPPQAVKERPPQTVKRVKQASVKGDWVVNVASSSQEASIKQLQAELKNKGVDTMLQRLGSKSEPRYRLRVTGFTTRGEAKRYAAGLAQAAGIKGAWTSKR